MKIKLDENFPTSLADELDGLGHDADTVLKEDLRGSDDSDVRMAAQGEGRFLITQDLDFSDLRAFEPGTHHGILLIRLRNASRRMLIERVVTLFKTEEVEGWSGCFIVATDNKVRVRRPTGSGGVQSPP